MIRKDKFEVGDNVYFDMDFCKGTHVETDMVAKWGHGPHTIEAVQSYNWDFKHFKSMGHTQHVTVNGKRFSGRWFLPVRPWV